MEVVERKRQMEERLPRQTPRIYWLSLKSQRWLWLFKAGQLEHQPRVSSKQEFRKGTNGEEGRREIPVHTCWICSTSCESKRRKQGTSTDQGSRKKTWMIVEPRGKRIKTKEKSPEIEFWVCLSTLNIDGQSILVK